MTALQSYPRVSAYLAASNYRLNDPEMTPKAWAVCISEAFTDDELIADGRVSFETMDGPALLTEFERLMGERQPRRSAASIDAMERLKAFIGSRGIRVSAFQSDEDYWTVARILWPHAVTERDGGPLSILHGKIASLTKKSRQSARENIRKVPAKWRAV